MRVIGISGPPRDSAACLVEDGVVRAAAQEERFSRVKHEGTLPLGALAFCLEAAAIASAADIDVIAFSGVSYESWVRQALPEFRGRVVVAGADASAGRWGGAAPSNARAAIGAALDAARQQPATSPAAEAREVSAALGPSYTPQEVRELLDRFDLPYHELDPKTVAATIAELAVEGHRIGVLHGAMEFGDVSVGHRSIVSAANLPPSGVAIDDERTFIGRVATAFSAASRTSTLIHAPFTAGDEPTVCSPIDAYRGLFRAGLDALVLEDVLVWHREQPAWDAAQSQR